MSIALDRGSRLTKVLVLAMVAVALATALAFTFRASPTYTEAADELCLRPRLGPVQPELCLPLI